MGFSSNKLRRKNQKKKKRTKRKKNQKKKRTKNGTCYLYVQLRSSIPPYQTTINHGHGLSRVGTLNHS